MRVLVLWINGGKPLVEELRRLNDALSRVLGNAGVVLKRVRCDGVGEAIEMAREALRRFDAVALVPFWGREEVAELARRIDDSRMVVLQPRSRIVAITASYTEAQRLVSEDPSRRFAVRRGRVYVVHEFEDFVLVGGRGAV